MNWRHLSDRISIRAALASSGAALLLLQATAAARDDEVMQQVDFAQRLGERVTLEAEFLNEQGETVRLEQLFDGRPVVLALVYYECPMLCTLELNGLVAALREMKLAPGRDFEIVTVSIDPGETPALAREKKVAYVQRYCREGAAEHWHFLTGKEENVRRLAEEVGFRYAYDADRDEYAHAAGIVVLSPSGRIARYFYGIHYSPGDLRLGLVEAAQGAIGSPADQLLLLCYGYDPATGKYGFLVMGAVRLLGTATVLALAGFVGWHWYRDWRGGGGT